jgi:acyl-coenzyme A thioesterase PaaI-like protein
LIFNLPSLANSRLQMNRSRESVLLRPTARPGDGVYEHEEAGGAMMGSKSLQETYAPKSICFGCGPANPDGLHIRSYVDDGGGEEVVTDWMPKESHHAFEGMLNGGIMGTLFDCHCNWTAAESLRRRMGLSGPPPTVTAEFHVKFLKPTPIGVVHVSARAVGIDGKRATVEAELSAVGSRTATFRGTFVVVGEGHPAYGRWI